MSENKLRIIANWLINSDNPGDLPLKEAEGKIRELGLDKIYREVELPLIEVLENMKQIGIALDKAELKKLLAKYSREIKLLEKKIFRMAGENFNLNSPKQLAGVLSKKLNINLGSTRAEKLLELKDKHPIIDLILRYREVFKIKSTYLEPLSQLGDRVRTTLVQTGAATGRLSSRDPNLQNIPPAVKSVFVADRGFRLVSFDYSQLELRILAASSGDQKMIRAFKEGKDIHQLTASQVFNVGLEKVTPKMRNLAKTLNFGVVYGMGATAFAKTSGLSRKEAERFIREYFSDFPEIKRWQERIKQEARGRGYVENINGRKRWLPLINSANRFLAAEAERAAINMPVQSLGADIIKLAMIEIYKKFENSEDIRMLLSIHDELLFEIKSDKVRERTSQVKEIMENIYNLGEVKLEAKTGLGGSWAEIK